MSNTMKARPAGGSVRREAMARAALAAASGDDSRATALKHVQEAFAILVGIMRDANAQPATRLRACETVIERAWGRVGPAAKAAIAAAAMGTAAVTGSFVGAPKLTEEEWNRHVGSRLVAAAGPAVPRDHG